MATFNYTVDTHPMADKMSSVSGHVDNTTLAVVSMQTAVIMAEKEAAKHICTQVNDGFYALIRSQISQKKAKLQSEVDSNLFQLNQQKKAVLYIRARMERDYQMISRRYIKLFNGLNKTLKNRVFDLDRPITDLVSKEMDKIENRPKNLTATVSIGQMESISLSQKMLASNIKAKGEAVINTMKSFLQEMKKQQRLTEQVLIENSPQQNDQVQSLPILIFEAIADKTLHKNIDVHLQNHPVLENTTKASIFNKTYSELPNFIWQQPKELKNEVKNSFLDLLSKSSKSDKVKELAKHLYINNLYETI